jgi:hypothetical protein
MTVIYLWNSIINNDCALPVTRPQVAANVSVQLAIQQAKHALAMEALTLRVEYGTQVRTAPPV